MIVMAVAALALLARADLSLFAGQGLIVTALAVITFFLLLLEVRIPAVGAWSLESGFVLGASVLLGNPWLVFVTYLPAYVLRRLDYLREKKFDLILYGMANMGICSTGALLFAQWVMPEGTAGARYLIAQVSFFALNAPLYLGYYMLRTLKPRWRPVLVPMALEGVAVASCTPLVLTGLWAANQAGFPGYLLSAAPLLMCSYAFKQFFALRARNRALQLAHDRQSLLSELAGAARGSLETDKLFNATLDRLGALLNVERMAALLSESGQDGTRLWTRGLVTASPERLENWFHDELENARINQPERYEAGTALLGDEPANGVKIPLATGELVFGALLIELAAGDKPDSEALGFLTLVGNQLSALLQDQLLKRELFRSNESLEQRNLQLSRILDVSHLLKGQEALEPAFMKIARAIGEATGYRVVLISMYHADSGEFERVAQYGLDAQWTELKGKRRPAEGIVKDFQPQFKLLNSFYVPHELYERDSDDVISMAPARVSKGEWHPMDSLMVPMTSRDGNLVGYISVDDPADRRAPNLDTVRALEILANQAVTAIEAARAYETIQRQALYDGLTDVHNHRYFQESLAREIERTRRAGDHCALVMMDIDNFKAVNDEHGHPAGDLVLKNVARCLRETIRDSDLAARYGGEEFAIFFPGLDHEEAHYAAERIRSRLAAEVLKRTDAQPLACTVSIGVAVFPEHGLTPGALIAAADTALYQAKRAGKNRVIMAADDEAQPGNAPIPVKQPVS